MAIENKLVLMENTQVIPWKRILIEGTAIVLSILLAFAIDAWWNGYQDRQKERKILEVLLVEFELLEDELNWSRNYYGAIKASALKLVDIGMELEESTSDEEIDRLLEDLWWWSIPESWSSAELNSIISNGDLALLSNEDLRLDIGGWPVLLSAVRAIINREHDFYRDQFMPYLFKHASLQQLAMITDGTPGNPDSSYDWGHTFKLRKKQSHREILSQQDFQNLLIQRASNLNDILVIALGNDPDSGYVADTIGPTIRLLRRELAK